MFCYSARASSENGRNQRTDETDTAKNGASYKGKRLLERFVAIAVAGLVIWLFWAQSDTTKYGVCENIEDC